MISTVRVIKSRITRWSGHVVLMGREKACTGFWWGNLRERHHLGDLGVDGSITLRWILNEVGCGGVDWIELIQDRDSWRALVPAVMSLRFP
jgi:hypothetical protein